MKTVILRPVLEVFLLVKSILVFKRQISINKKFSFKRRLSCIDIGLYMKSKYNESK